jgi:hypothetical protein
VRAAAKLRSLRSAAALLANASALNDMSWYDPPASAASTLRISSERRENLYDLAEDVLSTVAFLSEIDVSDIPAGLHMPKREQHEVGYAYAKKHPEIFPEAQLQAGLNKEMTKMFSGMHVLEEVTDAAAQVAADAIYVPCMLLAKQKYLASGDLDTIAVRLAMIGSLTDPALFGDCSAATADEATMLCCMSAFQADAVWHGYEKDMGYESFDVCGAFLHTDIESPVMIVTRLPKNINHPMAGKLVIVRKSCYGLRQSNKTFADDLNKTIISAGFKPTLDPCIYKRVEPVTGRPPKRCYLSTHVDDGKGVFNHRPFYDHLISVLEARYGPLKKSTLTGYTGTSFTLHKSGAFSRSQAGYVSRFLDNVGITGLKTANAPSKDDLFSSTPASPPCDQKLYRTLIGSLIHTLRTRYDIQKEVVHLSSKSAGPTMEDLAKVTLVLRYLLGSPDMGPTYYTTQGALLICFVDCSYGVHEDGYSQAAFTLHIGDDNAPFFVSARKQKECVAVGSMEGEYVALSAAARKVLEFRYFLDSIDFPQAQPTTVYEDNMSAINLASAPAITRKSRHIHIRHHFIRECVEKKFIAVKHLSTSDMLADFFTKPFGPKQHCKFRERIMNSSHQK